MAFPKKKFYVVWEGMAPGVYATWPECESAIKGFSNAKYKAFPTRDAAERAFAEGPGAYWGTGKFVSALTPEDLQAIGGPVENSLCVDAAWNAETKVVVEAVQSLSNLQRQPDRDCVGSQAQGRIQVDGQGPNERRDQQPGAASAGLAQHP